MEIAPERIAGIRAQMRAFGVDDGAVTDEEITEGLRRDPPLTYDELVNAKWGVGDAVTQRALAETALYWYDQAFVLKLRL